MSTVESVDQKWYLKFMEEEGLYVKIGDQRYQTKTGHITEEVLKFTPVGQRKSQLKFVTICFKAPTSPSGKAQAKFNIENFQKDLCISVTGLDPGMNNTDFCEILGTQIKAEPCDESGIPQTPPTSSVSSPQSRVRTKNKSQDDVQASAASKPKKKIKRASAQAAESIDLPSPQKKFRPSDIDQTINCAYIGHFHIKVDSLAVFCPDQWVDRQLNLDHVKELEEGLAKNPTILKNQQPWIGITDLRKQDIPEGSKSAIKGCQITVIGGRHRQAAYNKVSKISDVHKKELEKVWIHLYGSELSDEEVRRLACTHNTANKGSMTTNYPTRVHACRQWLYKLAGRDLEVDETPSSSQPWKVACQKMYAPIDKDPNTLEPTLQAALLRKDVYKEFTKVCELFYKGSLKDQKISKKRGKGELTQNQLGMPLQGLTDDCKLAILREVTTKKLSLKEMKKKCERVKKKQLVVTAFVRHAGESSWEALKERFPLHTTEEKLAQFSESSITKTKTPEEVVNFFEKAVEWEKKEGPINLQEEREGIFIYKKEEQYGILMEGGLENICTEKIKRIVGAVPFKGFSLVIASLPRDLDARKLLLFLNCVHAANLDNLSSYTVALFVTSPGQVDPIKDTMRSRFGVIETAYWVNIKHKRVQRKGGEMSNSVHPIVIGYWTKGGASKVHSQFADNDDGSNAFCFGKDEEECLPKELLRHVIKHFSLECQWVLDISSSKDTGLVSALSCERNCVSLMESTEALRETAKMSALSIPHSELSSEDKDDSTEPVDGNVETMIES